MEWRDEGVLLVHASAWRKRRDHRGVHGGAWPPCGRRARRRLAQDGGHLAARRAACSWTGARGWTTIIGTFTVEPLRSRARLLADRLALAGLNVGLRAVARGPARTRAASGALAATRCALLDALGGADWPSAYLRWEVLLLEELGFGLDLTRCAVTGATEGLAYVSPKTGRAVSADGGGGAGPTGCCRCRPVCRDGALTDGGAGAGAAADRVFPDRELAPVLHGRPCPRRGRGWSIFCRAARR